MFGKIIRRSAVLVAMMTCCQFASANSISFDSGVYVVDESGQITVTIQYDFTEFAMFGGGMNLIYDAESIEFVSYTQADYSGTDVQQNAASPVGSLESPGRYVGFGVGTFEFFNGITSAGDIGTFVFNFIGGGSGSAECDGFFMCLTPDPINPLTSLAGNDVTLDVLPVYYTPVPVPAAVWFLVSGVGVLVGFGKRTKS